MSFKEFIRRHLSIYRKTLFWAMIAVIWAGTGLLTPASAVTMLQQIELNANDGATGDKFGTSMALNDDGNTVIIGAPYHVSPSAQGAAYVYVRSNGVWSQQAELTVNSGSGLGMSVALSGDGNTALVGASNAVYMFKRNGAVWAYQTAIAAPVSSNFGSAVSLSTDGTAAIVGADLEIINTNTNQGAAYIYKFDGTFWNLQQKLTAGALGDNFGHSVAISGDGNTVLVGAVQRNAAMGTVYFYRWSGVAWVQMNAQLPTLAAGNRFGESVALSSDGNTAVVGADGINSSRGMAYVIVWDTISTWQWRQGIQASDGVANDHFGVAVAISKDGNIILVDAAGRNSGQGAAYYYTGPAPNFAQAQILTASVGVPGDQPQYPDYPGLGLSGDGTIALFGTPLKYTNQGAAYVFESWFAINAVGATCLPIPPYDCSWELSCSSNPVPAHGNTSCAITLGFMGTTRHVSGICYYGWSTSNCIPGSPKIAFLNMSSDFDVQVTFSTGYIWLFKNGSPVQTLTNSTIWSALSQAATAGDDEIRVESGGFIEGSGGLWCDYNFGRIVPKLSGGWFNAWAMDTDPTVIPGPLTISGPCALIIDGITVE